MNTTTKAEPIAVVGIGCRLPGGASNVERFWDLLRSGRDALIDIPSDRWSTNKFYEPGAPGKSRVRRGGFLQDPIDGFDAAFFGISPREADYIDPQQRLALEVAWEAIEDAGIALEDIAGTSVGVFVGTFTLDYSQLQFAFAETESPTVAAHTATGVVMTMTANRISHAYDLVGPSMAVDTACSSSLVAVHLACQSLWSHESSLALAGGVNLMLSPNFTIAASQGGFLSPTSESRAFDAAANGYVRGEGAGIVVLKPLADAVRDGDRVYATIRATAVTQDGRTNGITVPNGDSQERAIRSALRKAGVAGESISYVEAHGTGTPVGDPIEAAAIGRAYRGTSQDDTGAPACLIGSVKTNIGHLEAAAGVAGLIKACLSLQHHEVPPHLHLETVNPQIDLATSGLRIPVVVEALPEGRLLAGVNSFGFGGTNAHVIVESAPEKNADEGGSTGRIRDLVPLLPIAARTRPALTALADRYAKMLTDDTELRSVASALAHRRSHHRGSRIAVIADTAETAAQALRDHASGLDNPDIRADNGELDAAKLGFVYTGMGPQWWAMGRHLLTTNQVFREAIERCDAALSPLAGWSLMDEMSAAEGASRINQADVAQPANFALQVALTQLWRELGVVPDAIVGHSAGEVAAAYAAGALTFEDAVTVIYHRARLQHTTHGQGRLLAVALSPSDVADLDVVRSGLVEIAAINSPESVALVGTIDQLAPLSQALEDSSVFCRLVDGDVPYHSRAMDPLESELRERLDGIRPTAATTPLYSSVDGARVADMPTHDASYWWGNVRQPVRFGDAAAAMITDGVTLMLELGPNAVLGHAIGDSLRAAKRNGRVIPSLNRKLPDDRSIAQASAELYVAGRDLDWSAWHPRRPMRRLVSYPWQRDTYWMESGSSRRYRLGVVDHELLGSRTDSSGAEWRRVVDGTLPPYLADHRIHEAPLFPGAAYAEMAFEVARSEYGAHSATLEQLTFDSPFIVRAGGLYLLDTRLDRHTGAFTIIGRTPESDRWVRHARGHITPAPPPAALTDMAVADARCSTVWTAAECYEAFRAAGFDYGDAFRNLSEVRIGQDETTGTLAAGIAEAHEQSALHPTILDACFQLLLPLAIVQNPGEGDLIPVGVERIALHRTPVGELRAHARLRPSNRRDEVRGDVDLIGSDGQVFVEVAGFRVRINRTETSRARVGTDWLYEQVWEDRPETEAPATPSDAPDGTWLILADCVGVADGLNGRLVASGRRAVNLRVGAAYSDDGNGNIVVRADDRDDLRQALDAVTADDSPLRGVVHAWSCDLTTDVDLTHETLRWPTHDAPLSVVNLAQELDARGIACPVTIVTVGAQPIGTDSMSPAGLLQSSVVGLGRVLHHESLSLGTRLLDLDPADPVGDADWLASEILQPAADDEDQLARRGSRTLVPRLNPSARSGGWIPRPIRQDGTYIVTGGLGSLGAIFGIWLADHGARHIVLTGREGLPPEPGWAELAPDHGRYAAVRAVERMRAAGARVDVAAVDVADAAAMRSLVEQRRVDGKPSIVGVIHAAGVVHDQIVMRLDAAQLDAVLAPKILGSWALHTATVDEPVEFFVLCSSVSAVVPTPGQGNYAAGNAFLDALAHRRRALGLPGLSINWGPWDVGMIAELGLQDLYTRRGIDMIDESTGVEILEQLLGSSEVQQGVVSAHWPTVIGNYPIVPKIIEHLGIADVSGGDGVSLTEKLAAADPADRPVILADACAEVLGRVLRIPADEIDRDEALNRIGLDSMIAAEVRIRLEQTVGVAPSVAFMLKDATLGSIAAFVVDGLDSDASESDGGDDRGPVDEETMADLLAHLGDDDIEALFADLDSAVPDGGDT